MGHRVDNLQSQGWNTVNKLQSYYLSTALCVLTLKCTKKFYEKVGLVITLKMTKTSESEDKETIIDKGLNRSKTQNTGSKE